MKQWTEARLRSFIMSGIRRMTSRWGPKYSTFNNAFVEHQINPKTKRKRKMYRCSLTNELFPASEIQVDHIDPVIPVQWSKKQEWLGYNWNDVLPRMFCGEENLQAVSKEAHKTKTKAEASERGQGRIKKPKPRKLKPTKPKQK